MKLANLTYSRTIGSFYLAFAILAGVTGVVLSLFIRWHLSYAQMGTSFLTSSHALVMIVFMMGPALFGGFANWLVPMMIGAQNMAFPRLNLLAFLLLPLGFMILLLLVLLSITPVMAAFFLLLSLHILAASFILSAINFIATILVFRAPFMCLREMPPFVWSVLVASFLAIALLPVMSAGLSLSVGELAYESNADFILAEPQSSGAVMMWFFTHPEFFILMLPAFGIISEVIATFAGGRLVMGKMVNAAFVVLGGIGFVLWCETMLNGGDGRYYQDYFSHALAAFALPVALIVVSWLVTIARYPCLRPLPMLWAMGFMSMLLVAVLTSSGASEGMGVGHFHYILGLSGVFAIFAGWYFWFGKITGYEIRMLSGKLHFWTMFIAVHLTFLPQHFGENIHEGSSWGYWVDTTIGWRIIATLGACFSALSLLLFFYAMLEACWRKQISNTNPWGATGLEWQLVFPLPDQEGRVFVPVPVRGKS